ncbi:uncharacterized protein LOC124150358 isoform X2 [Haliotis rufescens]|uniref:uncharacterized protein LOC124150358 isoform X2 n=1 Tax=Haliotis rufescens TaxID=6454 RepID=UPI00201EF954|nr:uncharacterized protein LOC124150358 isoform X2 [Haliotis rufescens]
MVVAKEFFKPDVAMRIVMDSASSDHSPPLSENAGSSWANWENELSSVSGLNLGSNSELNGLVEDKEIAARAVAFVVNSTRKGIVPLCADVANLLHAKRRLEKKVFMMKRENEALRSSASISFRTSHSTSPTQPAFSAYTDKSLLHDQGGHTQERSRPCSRCSQCSSTLSNSPKLEQTYSFKGHLHSPSTHRESRRRGSPRVGHRPVNGILTQALIHSPPEGVATDSSDSNVASDRKNSLPEIISEPDDGIKKISPKASKESQCSLLQNTDSTIEEQFIEMKLNSKLAEELGSARKEIEILKGRLKELEMNHLARECVNTFVQDEDGEGSQSSSSLEEKSFTDYVLQTVGGQRNNYVLNGLSKPRIHRKIALTSLMFPEPLFGCKCTACEEAMGGEDNTALSHSLSEHLQKFPISGRVQVQLDDHVVIKGDRTGHIRYVGHLDKIGQPNMIFVGLELDAPVGRHDGFLDGKRYFYCRKDHGIFLPLHDIVCHVHAKKHESKDTDERIKKSHHIPPTSSPLPRSRIRALARRKLEKKELASFLNKDNNRKQNSSDVL